MRAYIFQPKKFPVFTKQVVEKILEAAARGESAVEVTLNLGLSTSRLELSGGRLLMTGGSWLELERLKPILGDERGVYIFREGELEKVALRVDGLFYQLVQVGSTAPTLEIGGIHMHRIKGTVPWQDSLQKVRAARVGPGHKVLDICTGLGYTASLSVKFGASSVLTVEKDEKVLRIAEVNPWSWGLADERVKVVLGDAVEVVKELSDSSFDRIIHDPPRLALAGELIRSASIVSSRGCLGWVVSFSTTSGNLAG